MDRNSCLLHVDLRYAYGPNLCLIATHPPTYPPEPIIPKWLKIRPQNCTRPKLLFVMHRREELTDLFCVCSAPTPVFTQTAARRAKDGHTNIDVPLFQASDGRAGGYRGCSTRLSGGACCLTRTLVSDLKVLIVH